MKMKRIEGYKLVEPPRDVACQGVNRLAVRPASCASRRSSDPSAGWYRRGLEYSRVPSIGCWLSLILKQKTLPVVDSLVVWNIWIIFPYIYIYWLGIIIPNDLYIFQRGRLNHLTRHVLRYVDRGAWTTDGRRTDWRMPKLTRKQRARGAKEKLGSQSQWLGLEGTAIPRSY